MWIFFGIAIACGYTDYQHLVKDYLEFTNTTPNKFFAEESQENERIDEALLRCPFFTEDVVLKLFAAALGWQFLPEVPA